MEKKTPLYEEHVKLSGKIVPFAGYLLPVQYPTGVIAEHMSVREACGLFDVSHMGEVILKGRDAFANLQNLLCNDFTSLKAGRVRYSPMLNDQGGIVDDLLVYKLSDEAYLIIVNASNREKDVAWMKAHLFGEVSFEDISSNVAQLALQGPRAEEILSELCNADLIPKKYYSFTKQADIKGATVLLSRTGYTGEDGFEIYCSPDDATMLWRLLLEAGKPLGLIPCGLGARDTLRLEAAMPLYGHEMSDDITPYEASLSMFIKPDAKDFIGRKALIGRTQPTKHRVGLRVTGRGIAREHLDVLNAEGQNVGITTSGTFCPYVKSPIAMAIIDNEYTSIGEQLFVDIRGKSVAAEVISLPFYKKN